MKKFIYFLIVSYVVAFVFEVNAYYIGDGGIFNSPLWPVVFFPWYGLIYSLTFFIYHDKSLWYPAVTWAVMGPIVEILIFKRVNMVIDPIIYAMMFFIPFWVYKKFIQK